MELGLTDLRVLVTGGSAGIGLATVELFSAEGARVAIASRAPGEAAAAIGATAVTADLSDPDARFNLRRPLYSLAQIHIPVKGTDTVDQLVSRIEVQLERASTDYTD